MELEEAVGDLRAGARQRGIDLTERPDVPIPRDLLAFLGAGAYAMAMASNYNSRGRAAEIVVDGDRVYCVRRRERVEDLFVDESLLP